MAGHEVERVGLAALELASELLQRSQAAHPTAEPFEAQLRGLREPARLVRLVPTDLGASLAAPAPQPQPA